MTNTTQQEEYTGDGFGAAMADGSFGGFDIVDSVNRKYYYPLRDGNQDGEAFGTPSPRTFQPGVRYQSSVFFPPIPAQVKQVSVLPPGSFGELSGVPVVDAGSQPQPTASVPESPRPGQTVTPAVTLPASNAWSRVVDLYSLVDHPNGSSSRSSGTDEVVALRTDVLFEFKSATLSQKAKDMVAQVGADMGSRADPAQTVVITGHTDGKGTDAFNQELSVRRAKAVRDALAGQYAQSGFNFQVVGKGESEPIAKETRPDGGDNPEGRARNRRVEITYRIKPAGAGTATPTAGSNPLNPNIGPPAGVHDLGPVVAQRTAAAGGIDSGNAPMRLDVHPFYRDGAYLVADFQLRDLGPRWINSNSTPFETLDLVGATYGSFTVVDPGKVRYSSVRIGEGDSVSYLDAGLALLDPNKTVRKYVYYPAPPVGVTSVTFDAGPFGEIPNVPIR